MYSVIQTQKASKAIHFQDNFYRLQQQIKMAQLDGYARTDDVLLL